MWMGENLNPSIPPFTWKSLGFDVSPFRHLLSAVIKFLPVQNSQETQGTHWRTGGSTRCSRRWATSQGSSGGMGRSGCEVLWCERAQYRLIIDVWIKNTIYTYGYIDAIWNNIIITGFHIEQDNTIWFSIIWFYMLLLYNILSMMWYNQI